MATISTSGINPGLIIRSEHLLRVINALNGINPTDIIITGSLSVTGSTSISGSTYIKGLPNTSRVNVVTYDTVTGQLSNILALQNTYLSLQFEFYNFDLYLIMDY
jgi:hypothetical protein